MSTLGAKTLILIAVCLPIALSILSRIVALHARPQRWAHGLVELSLILTIPTTTVLSAAGTIALFRSPIRPPSASDVAFYVIGMCVGVLGVTICVGIAWEFFVRT